MKSLYLTDGGTKSWCSQNNAVTTGCKRKDGVLCHSTHKTAVLVAWQLRLLNRHHFNFNLTPFSLLQLLSVFHCSRYFPIALQ